MSTLLHKYPDLLGIDSTGRRNGLNFPNTAFMVRSDEPRGRIVATFISDKETTPVVEMMFKEVTVFFSFFLFFLFYIVNIFCYLKFIQYSVTNGIQPNPKWLTIDKWDPYLMAAKKYFPNTQIVLCDWHEGKIFEFSIVFFEVCLIIFFFS